MAIPLITIIFPCFLPTWLTSPSPSHNFPFRLILTLTYFLQAVIIFTVATVLCSIALVTLNCIHIQVLILLRRVKQFSSSSSASTNQLKILQSYHQLKVLIVFCNQCFQTYTWINCQFTCAALSISLMYSTIKLGSNLPAKLYIPLMTIMCASIIFIFCVFDYGSRPLMNSTKLLQRCKYWKTRASCTGQWKRKFLKSFSPIYFRVGHFHKMDRGRGPATLKFCLQRTFLLLVQSKEQ